MGIQSPALRPHECKKPLCHDHGVVDVNVICYQRPALKVGSADINKQNELVGLRSSFAESPISYYLLTLASSSGIKVSEPVHRLGSPQIDNL